METWRERSVVIFWLLGVKFLLLPIVFVPVLFDTFSVRATTDRLLRVRVTERQSANAEVLQIEPLCSSPLPRLSRPSPDPDKPP